MKFLLRNIDLPLKPDNHSYQIKEVECVGQSESEIWMEFKNGSDSALSYIYRRYIQYLYNYGCQLTRDEALVQDCVQELFVDLIRNRKKLSNVHHIKFYLFTSIRRKILRKLIKERRRNEESLEPKMVERFEIVSSPEHKMINEQLDKEQHHLLSLACERLTERQREAILLYYYEGFSYKQVAEILGMSKAKSSRVLIYRAIEVLQSHLLKFKDQLFFIFLMLAISLA